MVRGGGPAFCFSDDHQTSTYRTKYPGSTYLPTIVVWVHLSQHLYFVIHCKHRGYMHGLLLTVYPCKLVHRDIVTHDIEAIACRSCLKSHIILSPIEGVFGAAQPNILFTSRITPAVNVNQPPSPFYNCHLVLGPRGAQCHPQLFSASLVLMNKGALYLSIPHRPDLSPWT